MRATGPDPRPPIKQASFDMLKSTHEELGSAARLILSTPYGELVQERLFAIQKEIELEVGRRIVTGDYKITQQKEPT